MSASHRKLARLPLEVFDDLMVTEQTQTMSPQDLRFAICEKLKRFRVRSRRHGGATTVSLKTVGDLLRTAPFTLLQALDPLLTFGKEQEEKSWICLSSIYSGTCSEGITSHSSFPNFQGKSS
jgi:hypothetical protein